MTIGTLFTLFVVPSVYVLIAKDHRREREKAAQAERGRTFEEGEAALPASG